jgi:hypothetical protein
MGALTLLESAKLMEPSRKRGVIQTYAEAYQPMTVAPVINTGGKANYVWSIEDDLAHTTTGKRNLNADFTASEGNIKPYELDMKIYGGKIQVDRYIQKHSPESMAFQESSQIRSHAYEFSIDLFEGAGGTSVRGFRHWMLNDSAYSGQEVSAGSTASGVLLATTKVDELLSHVDILPGSTYFYTTDVVMRRLRYLSRGSQSTEAHITYSKNEFGMWSWAYDGIPVVVLKDGKGTDLLSSAEIDGATSASDTCSLYLVTWGEEMASLVTSNSANIPEILEQNDGTNYVYERLEWYVNMVPHRPRCIGRVKHIKAAVS